MSFFCSETFDGLKSGCKIYEIFCEYVVEFVQPAGVGGVMIAMKQFERLLIVHVPSFHLFSSDNWRSGANQPIAIHRPGAAVRMTQASSMPPSRAVRPYHRAQGWACGLARAQADGIVHIVRRTWCLSTTM